jgi:TRAP-type C4-dicarboxylate transport system permease small subunit
LLAVAIVTASGALLRDLLGRPLAGTFEAAELVLAATIFFGLPYTSLAGGHVSVDFLTGRLGQRTRYAIIAANALICAGLFGVITW